MAHVNEDTETVVNEYVAPLDLEPLRYEWTFRSQIETGCGVDLADALETEPLLPELANGGNFHQID